MLCLGVTWSAASLAVLAAGGTLVLRDRRWKQRLVRATGCLVDTVEAPDPDGGDVQYQPVIEYRDLAGRVLRTTDSALYGKPAGTTSGAVPADILRTCSFTNVCSFGPVVGAPIDRCAESLARGFARRLAPADDVEEFLVDRVASCAWRRRRAVRVEQGIFDDYESLKNRSHVMQPKSAAHAVMVDAGGLGAFAQLVRHEAAIERSMLRALHELQRLQAERAGVEVPVPLAVDVTVSAGG